MTDPLAGSPWGRPDTVAGFVASPPNSTLLRFAGDELSRAPRARALDLGCGAARNAVPLAAQGWHVLGLDLSLPMLQAARDRARSEEHTSELQSRFGIPYAVSCLKKKMKQKADHATDGAGCSTHPPHHAALF